MTIGDILTFDDRNDAHRAHRADSDVNASRRALVRVEDDAIRYSSPPDGAMLWRSLSRCAGRLASALSHELERTLAHTLRRITTILGADGATLWSLEGGTLRPRLSHRNPRQAMRFTPLASGQEGRAWTRLPWLITSLRDGRSISLTNRAEGGGGGGGAGRSVSEERAALMQDGITTVLVVPCVSDGAIVGALSIECTSRVREWTPDSIEALATAANACGLVLVREQQHRDSQRHRRRENVGRLMLARLLSAPPVEIDLELERMLRLLGELLDVDRCALFQLRPRPPRLSQTHVWQPEASRRVAVQPWLFFSDAALHWESGRALVFSTLNDVPPGRWVDAEVLEAASVKSAVTMPLRLGEEVIGGIECTSLRRERQWQTEELELVSHFGMLAVAGLSRVPR